MNLYSFVIRAAFGLALAPIAVSPLHAQKSEDFAWLGTLETPPNASLVRAMLPAEALIHLQHPQAQDLRVFDATGSAVPFAFAPPVHKSPSPRKSTAAFQALPMYAAQAGTKLPTGAVQVRVQDGEQRTVWAQITDSKAQSPAGTDAARLPSALFDTRASTQSISAIVFQGLVPANAPTRVTLSTSSDLEQWQAVPVRGQWYRFEGNGAPSNDTIELQQPLTLKDRFLRVEWNGQEGVRVDSITGLMAHATPAARHVKASLPEPRKDSANTMEWDLGFGTPLAALELRTLQKNVLVPVRILGRNRASEPWRLLGHTVIYRLTGNGSDTANPAAVLNGASVRQLRVEATHGARLEGMPIAASAVFDQSELVIVAAGVGPYRVAAGGLATAAALPLSMLSASVEGRVNELPYGRWVSMESAPATRLPPRARFLPAGVDLKTGALWAVLLCGVFVLGGVAWSLLRRMGMATAPK